MTYESPKLGKDIFDDMKVLERSFPTKNFEPDDIEDYSRQVGLSMMFRMDIEGPVWLADKGEDDASRYEYKATALLNVMTIGNCFTLVKINDIKSNIRNSRESRESFTAVPIDYMSENDQGIEPTEHWPQIGKPYKDYISSEHQKHDFQDEMTVFGEIIENNISSSFNKDFYRGKLKDKVKLVGTAQYREACLEFEADDYVVSIDSRPLSPEEALRYQKSVLLEQAVLAKKASMKSKKKLEELSL